jgi:hypothetical protein
LAHLRAAELLQLPQAVLSHDSLLPRLAFLLQCARGSATFSGLAQKRVGCFRDAAHATIFNTLSAKSDLDGISNRGHARYYTFI